MTHLAPSHLTVSDKVSVINALMAQDRAEIRERQGDVFKLTYYVVPALIAIGALSVNKPDFRPILIPGEILVIALYIVAFFTFRSWLADARACQQVREAFYRDPASLLVERFEPIRSITHHDRARALKDNALWFPFGVTMTAALVVVAYTALR